MAEDSLSRRLGIDGGHLTSALRLRCDDRLSVAKGVIHPVDHEESSPRRHDGSIVRGACEAGWAARAFRDTRQVLQRGAIVELRAVVGPVPGPGHGECFIWRSGRNGKVVAVDAGGAGSVGAYAGASSPNILILSHDDNDHIRGAASLIRAACGTLEELWVPVEWAILIKQIVETGPVATFPDVSVSLRSLEGDIAAQVRSSAGEGESLRDGNGQEQVTPEMVATARRYLNDWSVEGVDDSEGFLLTLSAPDAVRWYGAVDLHEIVRRVRARAAVLTNIFRIALACDVRLRFFSIDLAIASSARTWEREGLPGTVTIANASEFVSPLSVSVPPGIPYSYALTRLTVQNRRALSTLLWVHDDRPDDGVIIWSDTDGNWLDHSSPLGLGRLIGTLGASSAPHHASSNPAHDRVWSELRRARDSMVMINAGGQRNQHYRGEFTSMRARRCCTWCRPTSLVYQDVRVSYSSAGVVALHNSCLQVH